MKRMYAVNMQAVTLAVFACAVKAQKAEFASPSQPADPQAEEALGSYLGYLNNVLPLAGAALLIVVYFMGGGDPEKNIKGPKVRVSHILVNEEAEAEEVFKQVKHAKNKNTRFVELAAKKSKCPSKSKGGHMGVFGKGMMLPEFEAIVFTEPVGSVHKVHTKFGWHVLMITRRDENDLDKKQQ